MAAVCTNFPRNRWAGRLSRTFLRKQNTLKFDAVKQYFLKRCQARHIDWSCHSFTFKGLIQRYLQGIKMQQLFLSKESWLVPQICKVKIWQWMSIVSFVCCCWWERTDPCGTNPYFVSTREMSSSLYGLILKNPCFGSSS